MKNITDKFYYLRSEWKKGPEILFFSALLLFLIHTQMFDINWTNKIAVHVMAAVLDIVAVLCVLYAVLVVFQLKKSIPMFLLTAVFMALFLMGWSGWSYYVRSTTAAVFLILMAGGRNYRSILKCFLIVLLGGYFTALLGLALHFSKDLSKTDTYGVGHSCGYIHPNTAALYLFLILLLIWYLFLRNRKLPVLLLFWGAVIPVWFYMKCRTISGLLVCFPLLAMHCEKTLRSEKRMAVRQNSRSWKILMISMPLLFSLLSLFLCRQMEFLTAVFEKTPVWNMACRFVQGGIAFSWYGVTLVGHPIDSSGAIAMELAGYVEPLLFLDNVYISELIYRGLIGAALELMYLSAVNFKCIRTKDLALLTISNVLLLFGLMEHYTIFPAYNFTLIYLFAGQAAPPETAKQGETETVS